MSFRDRVKLIGVTLGANLSMDRHVTEVIRSCTHHTLALRHIRPLPTLEALLRLDSTTVTQLHGTSVRNLNSLQVAQNELVMAVCRAPRSASATEL